MQVFYGRYVLYCKMAHFDIWNTHTKISFTDTTTRNTPYGQATSSVNTHVREKREKPGVI